MLKIALSTLAALAVLAACSQSPAPSYQPPPQSVQIMPSVQRNSPALAHHGAYVVAIQRALARKGYYHGEIDGVCGQATGAAIKHFQNDLGVSSQMFCNVGDKEWSALGLSSGKSTPATAPPATAPHERHLYLQ
jgi:peptidoglycan hydrolase-like protein with peptidoglycan-binding domain